MKNPHAQALGRLGGLAKAAKMTQRQREEQAERAEYARSVKKRYKLFRDHLREQINRGLKP